MFANYEIKTIKTNNMKMKPKLIKQDNICPKCGREMKELIKPMNPKENKYFCEYCRFVKDKFKKL